MGFSILTETLIGADLAMGLFDAQTLSYKKILSENWRDYHLPIDDRAATCGGKNIYYSVLKKSYDAWSNEEVNNCLHDSEDDLAKAVNSIVKFQGKRSKRKLNKQSSRIYREVKKMWKRGYYNNYDKELQESLDLIHKAFRESFIKLRFKLNPRIYKCIPEEIEIEMVDGIKQKLSGLYIYDESLNIYKLCDDMRITFKDARCIQLLIAPYIFWEIYFNSKK